MDFSVNMSYRIRQLTTNHLWLRSRGRDWRRPIVVTIRELLRQNWRKRVPDGEERRAEEREGEARARLAAAARARAAAAAAAAAEPEAAEEAEMEM